MSSTAAAAAAALCRRYSAVSRSTRAAAAAARVPVSGVCGVAAAAPAAPIAPGEATTATAAAIVSLVRSAPTCGSSARRTCPLTGVGGSFGAQRDDRVEPAGAAGRDHPEERPRPPTDTPNARASDHQAITAGSGDQPVGEHRTPPTPSADPDHAADRGEQHRLDAGTGRGRRAARAPSALRRPISRVRSRTDTSMMLETPTPPTSSEIAGDGGEHPGEQPEDGADRAEDLGLGDGARRSRRRTSLERADDLGLRSARSCRSSGP